MRIVSTTFLVLVVSLAACKKDKKSDPAVTPTTGSGDTMAGSGSAAGTADTMAGSGSAAAGSGSAAGSAEAPAADWTKVADDALATLPDATEKCEGKKCAELALPLTKTDQSKAMALFKKGCQTKDGISCAMVAIGFDQGMGVKQDQPAAAALYDRSCTLGYSKGCYNLAMMLANGNGIPADMPRAVDLLDKACKAEAWRACGSLGDYYLTQGQKDKAKPILELGCKNKDELSCETLDKLK